MKTKKELEQENERLMTELENWKGHALNAWYMIADATNQDREWAGPSAIQWLERHQELLISLIEKTG